jgi:hypothetical protein
MWSSHEAHHRIDPFGQGSSTDMKTLQELWKDVEGKTTIQIEKFIGVEVEVFGKIKDIHSGQIFLYPGQGVPQGAAICLVHKPDQLEELLKYSPGDGVCLTTRFTNLSRSVVAYYQFEILSIRRSAA